jgi:DNA-binding transcriptional regulator YhcF (GntR family)
MSEVFERSKTQGNARLVLLSLADTCSDEGVCFPSIKTIAKKANISEETTRKFLHAFEKIGLVEAEERFSPVGRRTSNTYKLNLNKVGDDELTKDVLYSAVHHSRHRSKDGFVKREKVEGDGMNQFIPLPSEPVHTTHPMNQFIPSIINHHKEPKIEPSRESSAVASHSSTQTNLFPTNPNEAHASGSATAELKSADGKETPPPMPSAPPRNKKSRESKPVDEKFIAELQRLNPDKDVEREVKAAQTWLLSRPDRKYTRGFLANWVIRSKNIINPDKFHNNNSF